MFLGNRVSFCGKVLHIGAKTRGGLCVNRKTLFTTWECHVASCLKWDHEAETTHNKGYTFGRNVWLRCKELSLSRKIYYLLISYVGDHALYIASTSAFWGLLKNSSFSNLPRPRLRSGKPFLYSYVTAQIAGREVVRKDPARVCRISLSHLMHSQWPWNVQADCRRSTYTASIAC